jgi:hypothetical protein
VGGFLGSLRSGCGIYGCAPFSVSELKLPENLRFIDRPARQEMHQ